MNSSILSLENLGPAVLLIIIAGICLVLLFCFFLAIFTLQIRKQVNRINIRLERIMLALQIQEEGKIDKKAKSGRDRKGLQLDDNDIQKLKKIGVGMD